jgi:hypothetical protein
MHADLDPVCHAAAILDNLDGDLLLMAQLLPIFTPMWLDWYGEDYACRLAALLTSAGRA